MANALPIILGAAAAAVLLGKKKKKSGGEPDHAPGSGMGEDGIVLSAIPAKTIEQELLIAQKATPVIANVQAVAAEVEEDVDKDSSGTAPKNCKLGDVSADRKYVCWGVSKNKLELRRVVKYKTARNAAAAVAMSGGVNASPLMMSPKVQFALWCWLNRNRKPIYKCTKRYKIGKKRCREWARY